MIGNDKCLRRICANYEQVENYAKAIADEENKWELHHRNEITEMKSMQQLKDEDRYYNVDAEELIFLTHSEHTRLHNINALPETRKKHSEAMKGEKHPMFGKYHSEDARKKMSESSKGEKNGMFGKYHSEDARKKISENHADMKGEKNPMFGKHHSEETKKKMSDRKWYNNGKVNIRSKECPEGYVPGRLKFKKRYGN